VLGTYIFLEGVINTLKNDGASLKKAIEQDRALRNKESVLTWKAAAKTDSMTLLGIESKRLKSEVTSQDYVAWLGKPVTTKIPFFRNNAPDKIATRPKAYWIPGTYPEVIAKIRLHGIKVEEVSQLKEQQVKMYRIENYKFSAEPFEGHFGVSGNFQAEQRKEIFYPGSVRIDTNQPLGDLVITLLEPGSPDSFLQWGFFLEIFNRTEYIEEYVIEPLARNMLAKDEKLRADFEAKKKQDPAFIKDSQAVYEWFYARSPYVDSRWLLYPVGIEE
jgi:hypothetical protein